LSKEEKAMEVEAKRLKRERKRAEKRAEEQKKIEDLDVLGMARHELGIAQPNADPNLQQMNWQHGNDDGDGEGGEGGAQEEEDEGGFLGFVKWLFARPKAPPKEWDTFRKDEIDNFINDRRSSLIGKLFPESYYFNQMKHKKLRYWGDRDIFRQREGRGVCIWPDPPKGGGESYYGLWRADVPNGYGVFRWFTGDVYLGMWSNGLEQGFGVYKYGPYGEFGGDRYEGMYFGGVRQGTGTYFYAGGFDDEMKPVPGGVYMGEWLKGKMHGKGILSYTDGEYFVGSWKYDKKDGLGVPAPGPYACTALPHRSSIAQGRSVLDPLSDRQVYVWGMGSAEVAGDKYEGAFRDGHW